MSFAGGGSFSFRRSRVSLYPALTRARRANKRNTRDLDLFLAFAPWRSREAFNRFQEVYNSEGWPGPRVYLPAAPTEYGRAEPTDPRNGRGEH